MTDSNSTTTAEHAATGDSSTVVPTLDQVAPARKLNRTPANGPSTSRLRKEQRILLEAEHQFAQYGFEGASLEGIGNGVGISRHNLLYYFASKDVLYRRVLDDVLTAWGQNLEDFGHERCSPQEAIRNYIRTKLRSSLERPNAAKVFTKEVMAGAPRFADVIKERVTPAMQQAVQLFEEWADKGLIKRIDFTHLIFVIWTATQSYAEHHAQLAIIFDKPALDVEDYDRAEGVISAMVLGALGLNSAS